MNQFNFHPEPVHNFTPAQAVIIILRNVRRQSPATRARWATHKTDNEARTQAKRIVIQQWLEEASVAKRRADKGHLNDIRDRIKDLSALRSPSRRQIDELAEWIALRKRSSTGSAPDSL